MRDKTRITLDYEELTLLQNLLLQHVQLSRAARNFEGSPDLPLVESLYQKVYAIYVEETVEKEEKLTCNRCGSDQTSILIRRMLNNENDTRPYGDGAESPYCHDCGDDTTIVKEGSTRKGGGI